MPAGKQDEGKQPGFKVSDRRSFVDGSPAVAADPVRAVDHAAAAVDVTKKIEPDTEDAASPDWEPPTLIDAAGKGEPEQGRSAAADLDALPPVDFHTFILSLGSSALLHLGELDYPDGREASPDLRLAKHTIDIIGMLQDKTRGNLNPAEARLIESLLYDLRLRYVERGKTHQEK
jgi:Domain of unknown function (DUF1844)